LAKREFGVCTSQTAKTFSSFTVNSFFDRIEGCFPFQSREKPDPMQLAGVKSFIAVRELTWTKITQVDGLKNLTPCTVYMGSDPR
jgi:hypothetical protein